VQVGAGPGTAGGQRLLWTALVREHLFGVVAVLTAQQTIGELATAPASLQLVHAAAAELLAVARLDGEPAVAELLGSRGRVCHSVLIFISSERAQ
jgi:hypothetical protein